MKKFILFFLILIPIICFTQTKSSLSKILWDRVNRCYSMFVDEDGDGKPEFNKIDDSKNGYLQISGNWPTCGCSCTSTVGAYKNNVGDYILLQSEKFTCNWEKKISSNKELKDILPESFGIKDFISEPINEKIDHPIFFVDFIIPRIGTDTRLKIELIPFGLKPDGNGLICFEFKEKNGFSNCKSLYRIREIADKIQDEKTLEYILNGNFDNISRDDKKIIMETIGDDDSRFKSKEELQRSLLELRKIYNIYIKLDNTELILGWNREKFFIKEKQGKPEKISFKKFLIKNEYWSPIC
ncbi:MAG TPA: hypothetical protein PKW14_06125 [Bacteroidota bacterium]|nr:hypothetical protein [Bacteroidota bacterium]